MLDLLYDGRRYAADQLLIGQGNDAGLRLPNPSSYEDERLALVREVDGRACLLVLSNAETLSVNGAPVSSFCHLQEGDVIQLGQEQIRCVRALAAGHQKTVRQLRLLAFSVAAVALLFLAVWGISSLLRGIVPGDEKPLRSDVYQIRTGYVLLQAREGEGYRTLDSLLADAYVGTGFVTTDGRFVTARHVAEPWMNPADTLFPEWAVLVENTNRAVRWDSLRLVTRLQAINPEGRKLDFCTDSARMDRSRDRIFNAGTRMEPRWKRSISIVYNDYSAALGDYAWFPVAQKGRISLASAAQMSRLQAGDPLLFVGSQALRHGQEDQVVLSPTEGRLKAAPGSSCLFHSSMFDPGDSGGPVLARIRGKVVAVGIISRKDAQRKETSGWSVPVSELYANGQE